MPFDSAGFSEPIVVAPSLEVQLLDKMLEILAEPESWAKGTLFSQARKPTPFGLIATRDSYCVVGAILKATDTGVFTPPDIIKLFGQTNLPCMSCHRPHEKTPW
jgi:hypothetical protein